MTRFEFDTIYLAVHIEIIELNNNIQAYPKHHVSHKNILVTHNYWTRTKKKFRNTYKPNDEYCEKYIRLFWEYRTEYGRNYYYELYIASMFGNQ